MPAPSATTVTVLRPYGGPGRPYASFAGKAAAPVRAFWNDPTGDVPRAVVYLHDGALRRLGELQASSVNRSFSIESARGADVAVFRVPYSEPLKSDLLALVEGRTVVIESSRYGEAWVGIVTKVRGIESSRELEVQAIEYAALLQGRLLGPDVTFGGVCSAVFTAILDEADALFPTGLARGSVALDTHPTELRFQSESAWDALNILARSCGAEWWTTVELDGSIPTVSIHFGPARGTVRSHFALHDQATCRVDEWAFDAAAVIYAQTVIGGSRSATEAFAARLGATAVDRRSDEHATALAAYRSSKLELSQLDEERATVHGFAVGPSLPPPNAVTARHAVTIEQQLQAARALGEAARVALLRRPEPDRLLAVTALSTADWTRCHPGDVITLSAPNAYAAGYDGPVRILAAQPMEEDGEMDLVVQTLERID